MIAFVCRDLIFQSKVTGVARALGKPIQTIGTMEACLPLLNQATAGDLERPTVSLVLIDLTNLNPQDLELLQANRSAIAAPIVAFGSHVDTQLLERARQAGCDHVMPRSQFVQVVQQLIEQHG